ncbi:hypothetical protein Cfor_03753 [Coptotermes formosanus]|uniref:Uncharacterized protein n=1 Tax=Coptotermes formosanus TaxID=36987 RepID=A0A6L2PU26_COPFO|nr:hypothetical protein Cfor_03753 [Coptotermes formosanus]
MLTNAKTSITPEDSDCEYQNVKMCQNFNFVSKKLLLFETRSSSTDTESLKTKKMQGEFAELQRARSQPNLLCLGDEDEEESHTANGNVENHIPLRSALSNPHLLDMETTPHDDTDSALEKPSFKTIRKRSALIAQWENMIQQNIEH